MCLLFDILQIPESPSTSQNRIISTPSGLTLRWKEKYDEIVGVSDADVDLLLGIAANATQENPVVLSQSQGAIFVNRITLFAASIVEL